MNKVKEFVSVVNENKMRIITRTLIIGGVIVGVTLASGLFKVDPEVVEAAEVAKEAIKKAAKKVTE